MSLRIKNTSKRVKKCKRAILNDLLVKFDLAGQLKYGEIVVKSICSEFRMSKNFLYRYFMAIIVVVIQIPFSNLNCKLAGRESTYKKGFSLSNRMT